MTNHHLKYTTGTILTDDYYLAYPVFHPNALFDAVTAFRCGLDFEILNDQETASWFGDIGSQLFGSSAEMLLQLITRALYNPALEDDDATAPWATDL